MNNEQLRIWGVSRDAECPGENGLLLAPSRKPSDDELRMIHDVLCAALTAANDSGDSDIESRARRLVDDATASGSVLTIEQHSVAPLAMGNYVSVVSVRPARVKS